MQPSPAAQSDAVLQPAHARAAPQTSPPRQSALFVQVNPQRPLGHACPGWHSSALVQLPQTPLAQTWPGAQSFGPVHGAQRLATQPRPASHWLALLQPTQAPPVQIWPGAQSEEVVQPMQPWPPPQICPLRQSLAVAHVGPQEPLTQAEPGAHCSAAAHMPQPPSAQISPERQSPGPVQTAHFPWTQPSGSEHSAACAQPTQWPASQSNPAEQSAALVQGAVQTPRWGSQMPLWHSALFAQFDASGLCVPHAQAMVANTSMIRRSMAFLLSGVLKNALREHGASKKLEGSRTEPFAPWGCAGRRCGALPPLAELASEVKTHVHRL